jgi:ABC-type uncharacterized transport system permease subunit
MAHVTVFCFLASYLVALALEFSRLLGNSRFSRFVMVGFGSAGLVAHTWYLMNRHQATQLPPLLASTHDWMLVLAWVVALLYLFLTCILMLSKQDVALGVFALPLVLVLVGSAYFLSQESSTDLTIARAQRAWGMLHASLIVFGMASGAVGLISGVMYLAQHRRLRTRHAEPRGLRMPSLARLAAFNRWAMILTFFLMTLGFASGIYLGLRSPAGESNVGLTDPEVITSGVAWLAFGALFGRLVTHRTPGGRQVAWLTICGCGFLLATLVGLQIITGSIHSESEAPGGRHGARREASP